MIRRGGTPHVETHLNRLHIYLLYPLDGPGRIGAPVAFYVGVDAPGRLASRRSLYVYIRSRRRRCCPRRVDTLRAGECEMLRLARSSDASVASPYSYKLLVDPNEVMLARRMFIAGVPERRRRGGRSQAGNG